MLAAGLLHAAWHAIVKSGNGLATLTGMGVASALLTSPFLFYVEPLAREAWPALALSILLHAGYKIGLAHAYNHGDLSRAYPLARGLVPLCALPISYLLLDQIPTGWELVGIVVVSIGVIAIATERSPSWSRGKLILPALGASLMVAGYSVVDAYGVRLVGWSAFTAWLIVLDSVAFLIIGSLLGGRVIWRQMGESWRTTTVAGILGLCSFGVFLWALNRNPVASVVAFRECSLIFATIIAFAILQERISIYRLAAVSTVAVGLFMIGMAR
ncbi:DMT family transporter [Tardiphaga sp. 619_E2_N8_4]